MSVDIDPTLAVHSGPGAVSVSAVFANQAPELSTGKAGAK